jgi:hypothetical protein
MPGGGGGPPMKPGGPMAGMPPAAAAAAAAACTRCHRCAASACCTRGSHVQQSNHCWQCSASHRPQQQLAPSTPTVVALCCCCGSADVAHTEHAIHHLRIITLEGHFGKTRLSWHLKRKNIKYISYKHIIHRKNQRNATYAEDGKSSFFTPPPGKVDLPSSA